MSGVAVGPRQWRWRAPSTRRANHRMSAAQDKIACPDPFGEIFLFFRSANQVYVSRCPVPEEGRCATSSTRGGMRWTRRCCETGDVCSGRRSRVVLTPRRWRQACGRYPAGDGGKKARSPRRARSKPKNHCAGNGGCFRCDRGDYARMLTLILHARLRALSERPAFPAPSD